MAPLFTLDVATDPAARRATLRLFDGEGRLRAARELDLGEQPARWAAAFDTAAHVRRMRRSATPEQQLADLGAFLGEHVLGAEIAGCLASGIVEARTLLVRVPDAPGDDVATGFASLPWEIARAPGDALTLLQRAVSVRVALEGAEVGKGVVVTPPPGEAVRVLLVFADPPGARPLAARLERERLRDLFFGEVLPRRNVEVDVLCHGVTRGRLRERIAERGGYHVVHWSGHGRVNVLSLADGRITGEGLVALFREAGGMAPEVMVLAACLSGAVTAPRDWASLRAGEERGDGAGFAGTALALLRAGVKQVAAMRWEVGDTYARRLARRFYRHLLADEGQHAVDKAMALARGELLRDEVRKREYDALDHVMPLVFGAESVRFKAEKKRSGQKGREKPRPQPLLLSGSRELDPPFGFVGRGEELTKLFEEWMGRESKRPVALIQGLAGLGKTSLAAEVVHLGYERFDEVLAFQAKATPLGIEELYRQIDQRLTVASEAYRERCQANGRERVFLEAEDGFTGAERHEQLATNLVKAMTAERILLVLDNFETNLLAGEHGYICADPGWEHLLEILANRLPGSGSRVVVTSRHKPAVLEGRALWIPMGALPIAEAKLYFQNHAVLRALWFGDDAHFALAKRILDVSRGHPLILARIADLAKKFHDEKTHRLSQEGRDALGEALDKIQGEGFRALPDLFAKVKDPGQQELEYRYLNDVATGAVDLLIGRLAADERRLLWVLTRAGEPMPGALLEEVVGSSPSLLLGVLCGTGLITREGEAAYAFHELVAERAAEWMKSYPADHGDITEAEVWAAYGEGYGRTFATLLASRKPGSRDLAVEMGRRGIRYLARARAFESMNSFASEVVISTRDPVLLGQVIADLEVAAAEVPAGKGRWSLRTYLADALRLAGRPDQALSLYERAAAEAEAAAHWSDVGWISHGWADALVNVGQLDRARETNLRSTEATRRAGRPRASVLACELATLRIDVMQGGAAEARPAIDEKLAELRSWWALRMRGEPVPETPDEEQLARSLLGGLDIAHHANHALERWQRCFDLLEEMEQVNHAIGTGEHGIARTRFNRYYPLKQLGKLDEARALLEGCLEIDRRMGDVPGEARDLSALAEVWSALGDARQMLALERQALALCERLPNPADRASSHNNLAVYLYATGSADEARAHQLAALVYCLVTGLDPWASLANLAIRIGEFASRGEVFALPPLTTLLADPAFAPLRTFLQERNDDLPTLQDGIDTLVEAARAET